MPGSLDHLHEFERHAGLIAWCSDDIAAVQIAPDLARVLHVAAMLEHDTAITVTHARSLGLTRSSDLAAFLPQWDIEEAEHARVLRAALASQVYDIPRPSHRTTSARRRLVARLPVRPLSLFPQTDFVFCVLGAAAEYVATVVYSDLAKDAPGVISPLLRDIARQEARHFRFFLAASKQRGGAMSSHNGRLAARALDALWEPIGVPTLGIDAWMSIFGEWLTRAETIRRLEMMDRVIDSIPHLGGARLMGRFLDRYRPSSRASNG